VQNHRELPVLSRQSIDLLWQFDSPYYNGGVKSIIAKALKPLTAENAENSEYAKNNEAP